eukprot:GGOE01054311.1.p2 GENE.GGOE01054311.1~~GGOE01054311.1.p2  ORF type:complete len:176 (+),score=6.24 GGOE01054311.1:22-528(+)
MAALCEVQEMFHDLTSDSNSDCDSLGCTNGWSADSDASSGEAPFVHSPYSFSNSSTPNSFGSLGYEISHIPKFPEYFGPTTMEEPTLMKPPQKHKTRKQRLPVMEKQPEVLQTKVDGPEDQDACKNGTHGTPCGHQSSWKRLRAKRGYAYFVCYYCGAKWRTLLRGEQ